MMNSDDIKAPGKYRSNSEHPFSLLNEKHLFADPDRRKAARQKTLRCAVITWSDGMMDAAMMDISAEGAKLRPVYAARVPARFDLLLPSREWRKCEVVRRTVAHVAVRFID